MVKYRKKVSLLLILSFLFLNFNYSFADTSEKITKEEVSTVESEILKLQSNILNSSKSSIEKLTDSFSKVSNYEETWNANFNLELDDDTFFGTWKLSLKFEDYVAKNSYMDSEFSSKVNLNSTYSPLYWTWMQLDFSSLASMISKDSEVYLLLKDMNFKVTDENISTVLEKLKEQFKDNKYLKLPNDENSKLFVNAIKNLKSDTIKWELDSTFSKPLLQAYKKSWDKFLLVPTKYACEKYFELEKSLSFMNAWYTPTTCSDTVYKTFLAKFIKSWELYITLWKGENTLWFDSNKDGNNFSSKLVYDENSIKSLNVNFTPDQKKSPWEWFNLEYVKSNLLNIDFNVDNWDVKFNFDSKLDSENNFVEVTSSFNSGKEFVWNFSLKDKKINWYFQALEKWYDYNLEKETFDYKLKNAYAWKLTWSLNEDDSISNLNFKIVWVWLSDKKAFLKWDLVLNDWDIKSNLTIDSEYSKFSLNSTWKYSEKYFKLDSAYDFNSLYIWKFNLEVDTLDNKSNSKIYFDINSPTKKVFKLDLESTWTRTYKDGIKIEAPTDYKDFDVNGFSK